MAIIEVLYCRNPGFVVDTSKLSVPLVTSGGVGPMKNGEGLSIFERGDSMNLLSVGITLPFNFSLSGTAIGQDEQERGSLPEINLSARISPWGQPPEYHTFPAFSKCAIPFADYEFSVGAFLDTENIDSNFELLLSLTQGKCRVSMLGVPSSLHGKYFDVLTFAKVEHNLPLVELIG